MSRKRKPESDRVFTFEYGHNPPTIEERIALVYRECGEHTEEQVSRRSVFDGLSSRDEPIPRLNQVVNPMKVL